MTCSSKIEVYHLHESDSLTRRNPRAEAEALGSKLHLSRYITQPQLNMTRLKVKWHMKETMMGKAPSIMLDASLKKRLRPSGMQNYWRNHLS